MLSTDSQAKLRDAIKQQIGGDRKILDDLRADIRPLAAKTKAIAPRTANSISLVAADGGNNQLRFDPFLVQLVRVVDSSNNEYCLEAISPTSDITALSARHLSQGTPLGKLMEYLGVDNLSRLSRYINADAGVRARSRRWIEVYRELIEWATLFSIIREDNFDTTTLVIFDGTLRGPAFAEGLFEKFKTGIEESIARHKHRLYLVGISKHSKVLDRYRLAMALEGVMQDKFPCYVEVSRELQQKTYNWQEYAPGGDDGNNASRADIHAGKMFLVKFGRGARDPIWPIDIFLPQADQHAEIFGYLLNDAIAGFPVPFYPRALQKAHQYAALGGFDMEIVQDMIIKALREILGDKAHDWDIFRLQDSNPAGYRYNR